MSTVIALHWNATTLHYAIAQEGTAQGVEVPSETESGNGPIETVASFAFEPNMGAEALGQRLAEAIASTSLGRAKVIVALDRSKLDWQHFTLPPCPADELPAVVRLQADHDFGPAEEELGFDFLPLAGDEQTPQEVLTFALEASELEKIRQVCQSANLTLERIVPLAAGWTALTRQASPTVKLGTQIFVAPQGQVATLWAIRAGRVVLFRQFQLATSEDPTATASAVGSQLRRTLLALSQHSDDLKPTISLVGDQRDQLASLASTLDDQLDVSVQTLNVSAQISSQTAQSATAPSTLPLIGIAIDESQGNPPLVDLLHPHRSPRAKLDIRTYALAAATGTLFVAAIFWAGYAKLQSPLNQAAKDQAALTLLEESLDELETYEQHAATIRDWNAEAPNLLAHLRNLSKSIRPKPLEDENFAVDQDIVLEKLSFDKRQLTLEALARNNRAVHPLETRLRASAYRPERNQSDPSETIKEYPWYMKSTIEITSASDSLELASQDQSTSDSSASAPSASDNAANDGVSNGASNGASTDEEPSS